MKREQNSFLFLQAAIQAAMKAGTILKKGFGTNFTTSAKESTHDVVTEFDRSAEKTIINFLKKQFPSHAFLAEESGRSNENDSTVCWIIDPLDGTLNFSRHIPLFCISIAAMVEGKIEVGVIYDPLLKELFTVERGKGAYLNGKRLHVSKTDKMEMAVLATGFPISTSEMKEISMRQFTGFLTHANPIRILGSAALTLAYIAAGRFDLYWGFNLKPWDVAAGNLLIEEAGGNVSHFDGSSHNMFDSSTILATNSLLHQEALKILK